MKQKHISKLLLQVIITRPFGRNVYCRWVYTTTTTRGSHGVLICRKPFPPLGTQMMEEDEYDQGDSNDTNKLLT